MHNEAIAQTVRANFGRRHVLVVGDLMLDRYLWGDVSRVSPEAPVPVLRPTREEIRAGAAGNLALNLAGLGLEVSLAGYVGDDKERTRLLELWSQAGIETELVAKLSDRSTITKTRIIAGHQHVLRVDDEDLASIPAADEDRLLEGILQRVGEGADAIVLSDYAKGVLSARVCQALVREARRRNMPLLVDPKGQDYSKYTGAHVLTPNLKELELAAGVSARDFDRLLARAQRMVETLQLDAIVVTRGEHGMSLIAADETLHSPAIAQEVFDVSGAGDTVTAALVAGVLSGLSRADMLHLANVAAGIVVGKVGTAPIDKHSLLRVLHPHGTYLADSIYTLEELQRVVATWHSQGERIVFTNGCFDLLHAGHVTYLQKAADEGERLIVGLNTDRSVQALKGKNRPIMNQQDRACIIAALAAVDAVILFDEDTPIELIKALRPDVLAKGANYSKHQVVGASEVESWGGEVVLVALVDGKSTSDLIRKIAR